jgi:outer membrane protein
MKKIIAIVIFFTLTSATYVYSQQGGHTSVQYEMSFATGDLGEYISQPSFRGFSVQYRKTVTDFLMVGIDAGWNVFYEKKDYDSYTVGTATLSGVQWRTQNQVPLLVSADYVIIPDGRVRPYVGLGIGTMYSERSTDMGTWRLVQNPWHFALKPEAGVLVEMSPASAFKLSAKYLTGFSAGDLETQGYFTIAVGFAFGY